MARRVRPGTARTARRELPLMRVSIWRTDEPCPCCGNDLVLLGDELPAGVFGCRVCGCSPTGPGYPAPEGFDDPERGEAECPPPPRPEPSGWSCRWPARLSATWPPSTAAAFGPCSCA